MMNWRLLILTAWLTATAAGSATAGVANAGELMAALAAAKGGDVIELAPGNYGTLRLLARRDPWAAFASRVTIRSAQAEHPAVFDAIELRGVYNLALEGVKIDYRYSAGDPLYKPIVSIRDSGDIALLHVVLDGDNARTTGTPADGFATGIGLAVKGSRGIEVRDSEIFTFHRGATFGTVDGLTISGNDVHDMRSDGMDFASVQNVLIENNHIHDFRKAADTGDHTDMIQFWTNGTDRPSRAVTITRNFLDIGGGGNTHSIFLRNEEVDHGRAGDEMFYRDITIEDNVIRNAHLHGITVGETDGLKIVANTLIQSVSVREGGRVSRPAINVKDGSRNVAIDRNVAPMIAFKPPGPDRNWSIGTNLVIQRETPGRKDHYRNIFVNAETAGAATLDDLKFLPGSEAARQNLGSPLSRFDTTPATPQGYIVNRSASADGLAQQLDATSVYGPAGKLDATAAAFVWNFGDGASGEGPRVKHVFAQPGRYDVTVNIGLGDGRRTVSRRTIAAGAE